MFKTTRLAALFAASAVAMAGLTAGTMAPAQAADKDCGDFGSQKAAQIFFIKAGGPQRDPHGLDGSDNDGRACESNPAPYYYGTTVPGGGGGGGNGDNNPPPKPKTVTEKAIVTKVIDGDTVRVKILPKKIRRDVRLIGIDTPEVFGGEECYGPEASKKLKTMLRNGTRVTLKSDPTQDRKDRYDRLLRYVTKNVGKVNVNRKQVFNGSARVYVYDKPFQQVRAFRKVEGQAKRADRGLWGKCR